MLFAFTQTYLERENSIRIIFIRPFFSLFFLMFLIIRCWWCFFFFLDQGGRIPCQCKMLHSKQFKAWFVHSFLLCFKSKTIIGFFSLNFHYYYYWLHVLKMIINMAIFFNLDSKIKTIWPDNNQLKIFLLNYNSFILEFWK